MPLRTIGTVVPAAFATGVFGPDDFEATARIVDDVFDSIWAPDHLLWHFPVLDPFITLASIVLLTRRVRLGFGILNVALRPFPEMAKMVASLDCLAGGRVTLGVGVGGEMPEEFVLTGVPRSQRGQLADVAIDNFRRWFGGHAPVTFQPLPPQGAELPIWIGGRSEPAIDRAARRADGWYGAFLSPRGFGQRRALLVDALERHGRDATDFAVAHHLPVGVGEDGDADLERFFSRLPTFDGDRYRRFWAFGSVDAIVARVGEYVDAGMEHVVLAPPGPDFVSQLSRLADDIVPVLRKEFAS